MQRETLTHQLLLVPMLLSLTVLGQSAAGQTGGDTIEEHVAAAKAAARNDYPVLLSLCEPDPTPPQTQAAPALPPPPPRAEWHMEPVKVFDNLYFVGQVEYSAWAVPTSAGIIVIDTIFDYSVEDEVVEGLKKLGFNPDTIKYVLVTHAHIDHAGGARYLQDRFGGHVIMSAADWDLLDHDQYPWQKPRRDLVAQDGQKLTLGDTTLTLYITPGHTPGTISVLIPVKDRGQPHLVAEWGGTAFNFTITPGTSERDWFRTYSQSAERFRDIVTQAGADALISNHQGLDGSIKKMAALTARTTGERHPYVIGSDAVRRFLTVADECAKAGLLRSQSSQR